MRILYLAPRPPFPPEERETVRPYHQIRTLAVHHDVDLVCLSAANVDEWEARERLSKLCQRVQLVPVRTPPQRPGRLGHLFHLRPLAVRRFYRRSLFHRLKSVAATGRYDLVVASTTAMTPYLDAFPGVPRIADLMDVGSLRWLEYANLCRLPSRAMYRAEAVRLMGVELKTVQRAHQILFAAESETVAFRSLSGAGNRVATVKTPVNPRAPHPGRRAADPTILVSGNLDHFPNVDAVRSFLKDTFPRVRRGNSKVRLGIAGKNPSPEIEDLAARQGAFLFSRRMDMSRIFSDSWLAVAPHRMSHGVRNEILEAMGAGVPVAATQAAASGLDLLPGRDIVVAGDSQELAEQIVSILADPERLCLLGDRGRRAIHNNYSHWGVSLRLEEVVNEARAAAEEILPV